MPLVTVTIVVFISNNSQHFNLVFPLYCAKKLRLFYRSSDLAEAMTSLESPPMGKHYKNPAAWDSDVTGLSSSDKTLQNSHCLG